MYALFALLRGSRTEMRWNGCRLTPCKKYSSNLPPFEAAVLRMAQGDALFFAKSGQPLDRLTRREKQVLQLIAEGKSTKDVASLLGIGVKTAETHRTRLMQKLDIHETASLVRYAVRQGIV
jgi:DNA-binding NarL/FixJ family response regulator